MPECTCTPTTAKASPICAATARVRRWLSRLADGRLLYRLKRPVAGAGEVMVLKPSELLRRLAALMPPPRSQTVDSRKRLARGALCALPHPQHLAALRVAQAIRRESELDRALLPAQMDRILLGAARERSRLREERSVSELGPLGRLGDNDPVVVLVGEPGWVELVGAVRRDPHPARGLRPILQHCHDHAVAEHEPPLDGGRCQLSLGGVPLAELVPALHQRLQVLHASSPSNCATNRGRSNRPAPALSSGRAALCASLRGAAIRSASPCAAPPSVSRVSGSCRGVATRPLARCAPAAHGRATGTCPTGRPARARRRNGCGRPRRPRARTRSCPAARECTWPRPFRSWPRICRRSRLRRRAAATPARAGSCIRYLPRAAASR